jgi:small conductance mechanosensitive channel
MKDTFAKAVDALQTTLVDWFINFVSSFPALIVAVFTLVLFFYVAKLVKRILLKLLSKFITSPSLMSVTGNLISLTVITIGIIAALSILNLETTVKSMLGAAGIIGLVLGLAFQDSIANVFAGVLIATRKPFEVGEFIETDGIFGTVTDLKLRTVELHNRNGQLVYIPSKDIVSKPLYNFSRMGKRRVVIDVGIEYSSDLLKVKQLTLDTIVKLPFVKKDEPLEFFYKEFDDSSINFMVRFWIDFNRQIDYRYAVSEAIIAIKQAFDQNGITIPFPIRTLEFGKSKMTISGKADDNLAV